MKKLFSIQKIGDNEKYIKLNLCAETYALQSVYAAGYIYLDKAYILLDRGKNNSIEVYLFPKNGQDPEILGKEFLNELINYGHYFSRVENNATTIKTIMQRVLFTANPKFAEEAEEQEIKELLKELEKDVPLKKSKSRYAATNSKK